MYMVTYYKWVKLYRMQRQKVKNINPFLSYDIYAIFVWAVVERGKDMSCVIDLKAFQH